MNIFTWFVGIVFLSMMTMGEGTLSSEHDAGEVSAPKVIVLSLADDFGYHNVGFAHGPNSGNPEMRTPTLDALARNGVILDRFYTYKYCSPTRSSLLTGRIPPHVNQNNLNNDIQAKSGPDLRMTLLPKKLKSVGWRTAMVGKSHLGARSPANLPINRGFDVHFGFLKGGEDHYTQGSNSVHGMKDVVDLWDGHALSNETGVYSGYLYTKKAVDVVRAYAREVAENKTGAPAGLFLYLAWHNTHTPNACPPEWSYPSWPAYNNSYEPRMIFNCMARSIDLGTRNVTNALREVGLWDDTLFFFAADNGGWESGVGANNYPLRGFKTSDFEGGVRVVSFLAGGKNVLPSDVRGGRHTGYISIADWYGTICNLVGCDPTDAIDGLPPVDSNDFWPSVLTPNATSSGRDHLWLSWSCVASNSSDADPTECDPQRPSIYNTSGDPTAGQSAGDKAYIWKQWKIVIGHQNGLGTWTSEVYPNGTRAGNGDNSCVSGCLSNIQNDPTEHHDLKDTFPEIWTKVLQMLLAASEGLYQTDYGEANVTCMTGAQASKYYQGHNTCWENRPGSFTPSADTCDESITRTYLGPMCFKKLPVGIGT